LPCNSKGRFGQIALHATLKKVAHHAHLSEIQNSKQFSKSDNDSAPKLDFSSAIPFMRRAFRPQQMVARVQTQTRKLAQSQRDNARALFFSSV
jgi:hypothetical protein